MPLWLVTKVACGSGTRQPTLTSSGQPNRLKAAFQSTYIDTIPARESASGLSSQWESFHLQSHAAIARRSPPVHRLRSAAAQLD